MKEIIRVPYLPFSIFIGNIPRIKFGLILLVFLWILHISLGLKWSPNIDAFVTSGKYLVSDVHLGERGISSVEWYLRATLGYVFTIFHWWLHASLLFTGFMYAMQEEIKKNPTKKHHSYIIIFFAGIAPLACYVLLFHLLANFCSVLYAIM